MLRPIYLQPGDKVALISPSGVATKEQLDAACSLLTSWELEPVPGQHVLSRHGRLAGTDEERLHDLQTALLTPRTSGPSGAWREITGCYVSYKRRIIPYFKETPNG